MTTGTPFRSSPDGSQPDSARKVDRRGGPAGGASRLARKAPRPPAAATWTLEAEDVETGRARLALLLGAALALLAVSRWDVNWSRIGMHGVTLPFFELWVVAALLRGLRTGRITSSGKPPSNTTNASLSRLSAASNPSPARRSFFSSALRTASGAPPGAAACMRSTAVLVASTPTPYNVQNVFLERHAILRKAVR